jgi:hypothetical protein
MKYFFTSKWIISAKWNCIFLNMKDSVNNFDLVNYEKKFLKELKCKLGSDVHFFKYFRLSTEFKVEPNTLWRRVQTKSLRLAVHNYPKSNLDYWGPLWATVLRHQHGQSRTTNIRISHTKPRTAYVPQTVASTDSMSLRFVLMLYLNPALQNISIQNIYQFI